MNKRIPEHIRELAERSVRHSRTGQTLKLLSSFILGLDQEIADLNELKKLKAEKDKPKKSKKKPNSPKKAKKSKKKKK